MFKVKDRCHKVSNSTGKPEMQFRGSDKPKIYTVVSVNEGVVKVCNNDDVLFDLSGNVIKCPPLFREPIVKCKYSDWSENKLVKIKE